MVEQTITHVFDDAVGEAVEQRNLGRVDDACATVARLMALIAGRLVREYPDRANSYLVLSYAHNQVKKNAYRAQNGQLMLESLVQAIDAARKAVALDPARPDTRRHLGKLTDLLNNIQADRKAAGFAVQ